MLGRTEQETIGKLARRIWRTILVEELELRYDGPTKLRVERLTNFREPMRRALPIAKPHIYKARGFTHLNKDRSYDFRIKPFNFLQVVSEDIEYCKKAVQPIAPFERGPGESKRLPWTDYKSGDAIVLDWDRNAHAGTILVTRLDTFIEGYRYHPESKAASSDGRPADQDTRGVLGRLRLTGGSPRRIGKEVDRLDEDEEFTLDRPDPAEYRSGYVTLEWALGILESEPASKLAALIGMSERRLRDIIKGRVRRVRRSHQNALIKLALGRFKGLGQG